MFSGESFDNDRDEFQSEGFVCVRQLLDAQELDELETNLNRYISDVVPGLPASDAFFEVPDDTSTLKQMQYMQQHDQFFANFLVREDHVRLAEAVMGEPVEPINVEYFNKPPRVGKMTPPHQDGYYFCLVPNRAVTMWIALDVVDEENGCLRYTAGSHRDDLRPHGASEVLGFSQGLQDWGPADEEREVMRTLQPGDMLAHHSLTVHRADANKSDQTRRALGLVYYAQSAKVDPTAHQQYLDRMKNQHQTIGIGEGRWAEGAQ